jgi:predicted phosphodiesterase
MHLLLLSDLHFRSDWFRWVAQQKADVTAIAGDLLDGFRPGGLLAQMVALKRWSDSFPGQLVLSSGNHDANTSGRIPACEIPPTIDQQEAAILRHERWMDALERPGVVTDGRSQVVGTAAGQLVVTTIPFWPVHDGQQIGAALWDEGRRLRAAIQVPWLVLHHEPPADTMVGGQSGDTSLFYRISEYQPDFVLSGHIHGQPYRGSFADKLGNTWCFNPGFPVTSRALRAKIPNHIVLDFAARKATWHATANVGKEPIFTTKSLD